MSYNLTKRTKKTVKFAKKLQYDYQKFKTIRYKLTASGNLILLMLDQKPMRTVSSLGLPKEQKLQIHENIEREKCRRYKRNEPFTKNSSIFNQYLRALRFLLFINIISKNQQ